MAVVLMGIWTGHFLGGFAWKDDPQHQFNWHPLLMTIALIFLYGNGE
jgi:cytochrome b-561